MSSRKASLCVLLVLGYCLCLAMCEHGRSRAWKGSQLCVCACVCACVCVQAGEADRVIQTKMPKHLFSGKMGKGTRRSR